MLTKEFLEKVCNQIKYKPIVNDISEELTLHINEQKENYIEYGLDEKAAEERAVENMGDGEEIGKKLNKIHKPRLDVFSLVLTLILIGFGMLVAFIKSERLDSVSYFLRILIASLVGLIACVVIYFFDYRKIAKYSGLIYIASSLLCIGSILFGHTLAGSVWIGIFGIRISPLYICTYLYIISLAGFLSNYDKQNNIEIKILNKTIEINKDFLKIFVLIAISLFLIGAIRKISMFVLTAMTYFILIVGNLINQKEYTKNQKAQIIVLLCGVLICSLVIIINHGMPYLENRLSKILNVQELDPRGNGFLNNQLKKTLENSKLFSGVDSLEDFFGLYDGGDVTALSTITAYYGKFFTGSIIILIILLSGKLIYNKRQVKDKYGKLLIIGLTSIIVLQAFVNILVNLNIIGFVGVALPFVSYGVNWLLINMMSLALILSVYRRKDINLSSLKEDRKKLKIKISYE